MKEWCGVVDWWLAERYVSNHGSTGLLYNNQVVPLPPVLSCSVACTLPRSAYWHTVILTIPVSERFTCTGAIVIFPPVLRVQRPERRVQPPERRVQLPVRPVRHTVHFGTAHHTFGLEYRMALIRLDLDCMTLEKVGFMGGDWPCS